jgi:hypothetical protein
MRSAIRLLKSNRIRSVFMASLANDIHDNMLDLKIPERIVFASLRLRGWNRSFGLPSMMPFSGCRGP